jgi:hypothetical protein
MKLISAKTKKAVEAREKQEIERKWDEEDWDFLRHHFQQKLEFDSQNSFHMHDLAIVQMESGHYLESYNCAGILQFLMMNSHHTMSFIN